MTSLIQRILQGDEAAAVELYQTYSPRIARYLAKRVAKPEDAEELVQDIFLTNVAKSGNISLLS